MSTDNLINRPPMTTVAETTGHEGSYVDWAAILAGAVFALAVSFLLISFGATLGLSLTSPYRGEGVSAAWLAIAAGIWFAWVMVTGFGAGGYIAGRMRRPAGDATSTEVEARDGIHGLMVWATGALIGTVLSALGVGGLLTAGAATVGTVADVASETVSSDYFANLMLRDGTAAQSVQTTGAGAGSTDTAQPITQQSTSQTGNVSAIDPAVQQQIAAILARGATEGAMSDRDQTYITQVVTSNTTLDQTAASARVAEVNAEIAEARDAAIAAVDDARVAGVVFGFIAAATLLIGALAAFFAAVAGGRHRADGLGLETISTLR